MPSPHGAVSAPEGPQIGWGAILKHGSAGEESDR